MGGRTKWFILGLLFLSTVINYLDCQALSILAITVQKDLRMPFTVLGRLRGIE